MCTTEIQMNRWRSMLDVYRSWWDIITVELPREMYCEYACVISDIPPYSRWVVRHIW